MPPAEPTSLIPSAGADGCTSVNEPEGPPDWLSTMQLPVSAVLAIRCSPMALWTDDRSRCILSRSTARLLGFPEKQSWVNKERWLARIDPRHRERVSRSWQGVKADRRERVCRYVFWPLNGSPAILLEETARRIAASGDQFVVLCRYQAKTAHRGKSQRNLHGRSSVRDLIHQIGNNLQAVRGEVELLRLFGELPQKSFENIMCGIESIYELAAQMEAPTALNGSEVFGAEEDAPIDGPEKARGKGIKGV
jgi:hypothetical protein